MSTAAILGYADYEQLTGGIETLFGTQAMTASEYAISVGKSVLEINKEYNRLNAAQNVVMRNADKAYKSAGLSANEYMESVTSFSAALISSLNGDTLKAAEKADQAIVDMSDNANKMGTSMELIQNAYQGFAKQNYMLLDNLKLGYGGTKEEMQRLLQDAQAISGIEYDISSYADVVDAIHVIQTEMGITGTTAKEASSTISGSMGMMKSAWSNLLVGVADDSQNFDALATNFVDSVATVADNILPRVETTLVGVGQLVESLLPVIVDRIPEIIDGVLPQLIQSGMNMITTLLNGIQANLPKIVNGAILIIQQLITTFITMLPQIVQMGLTLIVQLALGIGEALPGLMPVIVETMLIIVDTLLNNIDMLVDAAIAIMMALTQGLIDALPILIEKAPEIILKLLDALVENVPKLLEAGLQMINTLRDAFVTYMPQLLAKVPELIVALVNKFFELSSKLREVGKKFVDQTREAFTEKWNELIGNAPDWVQDLLNSFLENLSGFYEIGSNIIDGIWSGLEAGWDWLVDKVGGLADSLFEAAKDALDIHSPSRKFKYLAQMCVAGWDEGAEDLMNPTDMQRNINATLAVAKANVSGSNNKPVPEGSGGITQHIYVNKEVATADEMARAIKIESKYGLMVGV